MKAIIQWITFCSSGMTFVWSTCVKLISHFTIWDHMRFISLAPKVTHWTKFRMNNLQNTKWWISDNALKNSFFLNQKSILSVTFNALMSKWKWSFNESHSVQVEWRSCFDNSVVWNYIRNSPYDMYLLF